MQGKLNQGVADSVNQQVEKFMLSPIEREAPVRREVALCPDGKVAIKTTCTKCGKAFTIKMKMERFLIYLTADHSASYAYAFGSCLMNAWDKKDVTVVCDSLTFLPTQCGGCGYKIGNHGIEDCRWSGSRGLGKGFCQIESRFARDLRSVPEAQQGVADAEPLVASLIFGYDSAREIEIALKSGNQVEMSTKCYRSQCRKILTSILDSHEFIAILSNEIGVADAMRLWDMIKKSPVKGKFYCLSRYIKSVCSVCRQTKDYKKLEDSGCAFFGALWSNTHLIKEKMHKNADGTFDFERKCSGCGKAYKIHLPVARFLEWECWLEQFTFEWNWLHAYDYDDFRDHFVNEFWKELSNAEVDHLFLLGYMDCKPLHVYGLPIGDIPAEEVDEDEDLSDLLCGLTTEPVENADDNSAL